MAANFVETREPSGRTIVDMNDNAPGLLWLGVLICASPMLVLGFDWRILLLSVLGYAVLVVLYFLTRKHVRLAIDLDRRVLVLRRLSIPLDQVVRAELASRQGASYSGPGGARPVFHRVDIVLRSGKRVPTIRGFGQFEVDDCHRLVDLINAAVGTR
jgi:hypothetical protein